MILNIFGRAMEELQSLCDGTRKFTMSVPVRDDDSDMVLLDAIRLGSRAANHLVLALPYLDTLSKTLDHPHLRSIIAEGEAILKKVDGQ